MFIALTRKGVKVLVNTENIASITKRDGAEVTITFNFPSSEVYLNFIYVEESLEEIEEIFTLLNLLTRPSRQRQINND